MSVAKNPDLKLQKTGFFAMLWMTKFEEIKT